MRTIQFLEQNHIRTGIVQNAQSIRALPGAVEETSRIWRNGRKIWEKSFLSGEAHMTHSLANLEYHHSKYELFCRPGDVHAHFLGTATLSFADGFRMQEGDEMEIEAAAFGRPLRNPIRKMGKKRAEVRKL